MSLCESPGLYHLPNSCLHSGASSIRADDIFHALLQRFPRLFPAPVAVESTDWTSSVPLTFSWPPLDSSLTHFWLTASCPKCLLFSPRGFSSRPSFLSLGCGGWWQPLGRRTLVPGSVPELMPLGANFYLPGLELVNLLLPADPPVNRLSVHLSNLLRKVTPPGAPCGKRSTLILAFSLFLGSVSSVPLSFPGSPSE